MVAGKDNVPNIVNNGDEKENGDNRRENTVEVGFGVGGRGGGVFEDGVGDDGVSGRGEKQETSNKKQETRN